MTRQAVFLEICDRFLNPGKEPLNLGELSAEDLGALLSMGSMHSIYPIVYDALRTSPAFAQLPEETQARCRQSARKLIIGQTTRTMVFLRIYEQIVEKGVTPLVMKGCVLRELYCQPDYRASSDEDLLIRPEEFDRMDKILQDLGFYREEVENPSLQHEITFYHRPTGMHLELHMSLFPRESGAYGRLNGEFPDIFERRSVVTIQGTAVYTLEPTQHMLYLLCHGLKHFLHCGFGIRQLCDMVMFAQAYGSEIRWPEVIDAAKRQNFYRFWINLFDIGEKYLGFSWEKACLAKPEDLVPDSDAMLQDILEGGIYGQSSQTRLHSANITLRAAESGGKKDLRRTLFPGLAYMSTNYPYLKRYRFLLPAAWVQRAFRYLRRSSGQEISETVETGNHRVELLKQYGIVEDSEKRSKSCRN